jgi:purine-binding chemotaxis protein CheW
MASNALARRDTEVATDQLIQLVSFILGNEEYGTEVLKVREIIRMPQLTRMPNAPACMEGIINLRGKVIPVISMRKRFGLPELANDSATRIIIMDVGDQMAGFIVDGVSEVVRIRESEIQPAPALSTGGPGQEFICGVLKHGERLLIIMDVDRVFSADEQVSLAGL